MLKCHIDRKKNKVRVKGGGDGWDIIVETLTLIGSLYQEISRQNPKAGEAFKTRIIVNVLDPNSPVWKEEQPKI